MPVTNYYSVNGELLGEKAAGGQRTDYLTDALGSVTATADQTGSVVNRYRYKPYGSLLSKSGTGSDPSFQWVGSLGYRQTGKKYSDVYVRARHYDTANGRWTSQDALPILPPVASFDYVGSKPTNYVDPSGLVRLTPTEVWNTGEYTPQSSDQHKQTLCCGAFKTSWRFSFSPDNFMAPCTGFFVQRVKVEVSVKDCPPPVGTGLADDVYAACNASGDINLGLLLQREHRPLDKRYSCWTTAVPCPKVAMPVNRPPLVFRMLSIRVGP